MARSRPLVATEPTRTVEAGEGSETSPPRRTFARPPAMPGLETPSSVATRRWLAATRVADRTDAAALSPHLRRSAHLAPVDVLGHAGVAGASEIVRAMAILSLVEREESDADAALATIFEEGTAFERRAILGALVSTGTPRHLPLADTIADEVTGDEEPLHTRARAALAGRTK